MKKALHICIICNILVLCIFVPWYPIISSVPSLEAIIAISVHCLIGLSLAIIIQYSLVIAHITSVILYFVLIIEYRTNKTVQKWLVFFTVVFFLSIIYYTYVGDLYSATLSFKWWGNTKKMILLF